MNTIQRPSLPAVVRIFLAIALFIAALLKSFDSLSRLDFNSAGFGFSFQSLLIGLEFLVAAWLLSGKLPAQSLFATFGLFLAFLGHSVVGAYRGLPSCGCLGRVTLDPRIVIAFDAAIVALLVVTLVSNGPPTQFASAAASRFSGRNWLYSSVFSLICILSGTAVHVDSSGHYGLSFWTGPREIVVLSPVEWIGAPLPIVDDVVTDVDLRHGKWQIILFHPDCHKCRQLIKSHTSATPSHRPGEAPHDVLFLEIPSINSPPIPRLLFPENVHSGRMNDRKSWFATTPTTITIEYGTVVAVSA